MRISSNTLARSYLAVTQRNQAELLKTQLQIATGRRISKPSDDPGATVRIEALKRGLQTHEIHEQNAEAVRRRLSIEEEALGQVTDILDRMRELTIRANTATLDSSARKGIADEVRQLREGLIQAANSQDGRGEYLFAGYRVAQVPFAEQGSQVVYQGDQGRRQIQIGETRRIADGDPGDLVFMAIEPGRGGILVSADAANSGTGVVGAYSVNGTPPTGSYAINFTAANAYEVRDGGGALVTSGTYAPGDTLSFAGISVPLAGNPASGDTFSVTPGARDSVFEIANQLIVSLQDSGTDAASNARRQNGFAAALNGLDGALSRISGVRTDVGARLSSSEDQKDINEGFRLQLETTLSALRDVDYAEAITRLESQLTSLQAAQQSYAQSRQLSLFDYI